MATLCPPTTRAAATALTYILDGFALDRSVDAVTHHSLPGLPDAVRVPGHDALVVTIDVPADHGRDAIRLAAADRHLDIMLLRVVRDEDGAVAVSVDLTLAALPHAPWSFADLSLWAGADGTLWLVPVGFGPAIEVTAEGLMLDLVPPYPTSAERTLGILRAGAEIACRLVEEARR